MIFFGYDGANSPGQAAIAVVLDEGIKWLLLLFHQWLFRWAMAEPEIQTLELQDEKGWHLVFRQTAPFVWPRGHIDLCEFDPLADNFSKLDALEDFRHPNGELVFMMRWPSGRGGRKSVWAQRSNPLFDTVVSGFRPIRLSSRHSVPLKRSPDDERALIVGGHPRDGEGSYYCIGHRLLKKQRGTWKLDITTNRMMKHDRSTSLYSEDSVVTSKLSAEPSSKKGGIFSPRGLLHVLDRHGSPSRQTDEDAYAGTDRASLSTTREADLEPGQFEEKPPPGVRFTSAYIDMPSLQGLDADADIESAPTPASPPPSPPGEASGSNDGGSTSASDALERVPVALTIPAMPNFPSFASTVPGEVPASQPIAAARAKAPARASGTPGKQRPPAGARAVVPVQVAQIPKVQTAHVPNLPDMPSFATMLTSAAPPRAGVAKNAAAAADAPPTSDGSAFGRIQSSMRADGNEEGGKPTLLDRLHARDAALGPQPSDRGTSVASADWSNACRTMSHDKAIARPPARSLFDVVFHRYDHPPPLVELYALNPKSTSRTALRQVPLCVRLRRQAATFAVLREREMLEMGASRMAARPYKKNVVLQGHDIRRMRVRVQRQWLLQFADGRVALFVIDPLKPEEPPIFLPVLRVVREREAWMNMRLTKRTGTGKDNIDVLGVGGRYNTSSGLVAEYELARTDGRVLSESDILQEPLALHNEIGKLKRALRRKTGAEVHAELAHLVQRLPRHYSSVGARVYNPTTAKWKMQILWLVMIGICVFLVIVFFSCVAVYWEHVESVGTDKFLEAYLFDTLLIQAFACEFREIFNIVFANFLLKELILLFCCLRCASAVEKRSLGLTHQGSAALERDHAIKARRGLARGLSVQISRLGSIMRSMSTVLPEAPPRALSETAEAMLFTVLRNSISKHAVAISQLRGARRAWKGDHRFSRVAEEERLLHDLNAERASSEWTELRRVQLMSNIHNIADGIALGGEDDPAGVDAMQLRDYLASLATQLLPPPQPRSAPSSPSKRKPSGLAAQVKAAVSAAALTKADDVDGCAEAIGAGAATGGHRRGSFKAAMRAAVIAAPNAQVAAMRREALHVPLARVPTGLPPGAPPMADGGTRSTTRREPRCKPPSELPPGRTLASLPTGRPPAIPAGLPPTLPAGMPPAFSSHYARDGHATRECRTTPSKTRGKTPAAPSSPTAAPSSPPPSPPSTEGAPVDDPTTGQPAVRKASFGRLSFERAPKKGDPRHTCRKRIERPAGTAFELDRAELARGNSFPRTTEVGGSSASTTSDDVAREAVVHENTSRSDRSSFLHRTLRVGRSRYRSCEEGQEGARGGARGFLDSIGEDGGGERGGGRRSSTATTAVSKTGSIAAGSEPRFIPGRSGVTEGYLLPLARELQFNYEEPPEPQTAEADRFHALELLSVWEEQIEARELAGYWTYHHHVGRAGRKDAKIQKVTLKKALRAGNAVARLQAAAASSGMTAT